MVRWVFIWVMLVVTLAGVGEWVRSYWRCDVVGLVSVTSKTKTDGMLASATGQMALGWIVDDDVMQMQPETRWHYYSMPKIGNGSGLLEFNWRRVINDPPMGGPKFILQITVPWWFAIIFPATAGFVAWWRRPRKVVAGMCAKCGYDLRGSPGRCSECGEAVVGVGGLAGRD